MNQLAPAARVGWCPGALRPMASGDGLILRVKPRGGRLSLVQARRLADVVRRHGNGLLDLTSRANLQIRGVGEATLDAVVDALNEVGLLDQVPEAEAVRNVVSSPLAGFDRTAMIDIRPFVAALERRLAEDVSLHALPAKFGFVVDDGGALGLGKVSADIRFEPCGRGGTQYFAVTLGGAEGIEGRREWSDLVETAAALAGRFIAAHRADPDIRRMRHLVRRDGAKAILAAVDRDLRISGENENAAPMARGDGFREHAGARRTRDGTASRVIGGQAAGYFGVAAPFGRLSAGQFETIVAEEGAGELRLTPWRAILLPGLFGAAATRAANRCAAAGLIVDASDPRLSVAACPGAPGCHRGTTAVLADAARLARGMGSPSSHIPQIDVHVSGCEKGCAHAGQAPVTLVGRAGLYDIVLDGRPGDAPVVRDLSVEEVQRWLGARAFMREPAA